MDLERPYRALPKEGIFHVVDENDRTILTCRDQVSAEQYVVLLWEAYQRGYRRGRRDARQEH
jgi:hypothetical protein